MEYRGFIYGSYETEAATADAEKTVNYYIERMQSEGATTRAALYPTPGVTRLSAGMAGPGRGHFYIDGREFAVIGTSFIEIDSAGNQTVRGTVAVGTDPATISSNGDGGGQLFVTAGGNGYVFTLATNAFAQIAALNGIATMGGHLDGYFLALDGNNSKLYISHLLDGSTWTTGTDFAQRSIAPDPWISMMVLGRLIYLFGQQTSEVWYNAGTASFPFAPHQSGLIPFGCAAAFSPSINGREILWLGTSVVGGVQVLRTAGFQPEVVSTYPVQASIGAYSVISDAVGDTYNERGHTFYLLSFGRQDVTWCFDAETSLWHERGTWDSANNRYTALRPRWHAYAFGQHRMLDSQTGAVYVMSSTVGTDVDGNGIRRLRRAPALESENQRIFISAFELDLEVGLGATTGQGSDPQVMMRASIDGGKTWGPERWRSAGKVGEYGKRVRWTRLGAGRRRVFEVVCSDPVPYRITNAYLTLGQAPQQGRQAA